MKRSAGFTLLEFLIITAIIAILVVVAIPSFLGARKSAAESKVMARMKRFVTANEQYNIRFDRYADTEANLIAAGLTHDYSASPTPAYTYNYTGATVTWSMGADPTNPGVSGDNYFFVDQSGVVRFNGQGPATSTSQPVE